MGLVTRPVTRFDQEARPSRTERYQTTAVTASGGNFIHQQELIMRKLTITLALLTIATVSHAGVDICSMKRSQNERAQCYEYAVSGGLLRMKKNYERIMAAPNVPKAEKEKIPKNHKKWADYVEKQCSDNACYYNYISDRNQYVEQIMVKYGINPI
ncbi:hypothetical protein ACU4HD_19600 [Cupriavidus basilensis]